MSSLLGKRGRTARICWAFLPIPREFVSPSRILCGTRDVEDLIKLEQIPLELDRQCHSRESGNPAGHDVPRPLDPRFRGDDKEVAIQLDRQRL